MAFYGYRGDGKRAWTQNPTRGNRTYFYYAGYAGDTLIGTSGDAPNSASSVMLWGADGLIGVQSRDAQSVVRSSFFLYDAQGNLAQSVDGEGNVTPAASYTAWGEVVPRADGTVPGVGTFGYGAKFGYLRDGETGFYLCTYRHYDPSAGRWITRDPVRYAGGSNLYGYVGNNPTTLTDPKGEWGLPLLLMAAGASFSGWGSVGFQAYDKGWGNMDGGDIAIAASVGAATSAVSPAATASSTIYGTIGRAGLLGGFSNGVQYSLTEYSNGKPICEDGLFWSVSTGTASGLVGGALGRNVQPQRYNNFIRPMPLYNNSVEDASFVVRNALRAQKADAYRQALLGPNFLSNSLSTFGSNVTQSEKK